MHPSSYQTGRDTQPWGRVASWLAAVVSAALAMPIAAQEEMRESTDARFLDGLRQRQLFRLAEAYCLHELARDDLPPERRAELAVQLSQTFAAHAVQSPPAAAEPLWQQAGQAVADFAAAAPDSPWVIVARVQAALVLLDRGELVRQQAEISGGNPRLLSEARGYLRAAIAQLLACDEEIVARLRRSVRPRDPAELPRAQLLSLQKNTRYQLARAYRNQALCYSDGSADRVNALGQATELLNQLARLSAVDPLSWKSKLDAAVCYRLLRNYPAAELRLDLLEKQDARPEILLRCRAERVRIALAQAEVAKALELLAAGRTLHGHASPDLDFAYLEAYLAARDAALGAGDEQQAERWKSEAAAVVKDMPRLHAPYWVRRAELLFSSRVTGAALSGELAVLVAAAQSLLRAEKLDEALQAFDQAAAEARRQNQLEQAFDLSYTAAALEHQRQHSAAALRRFRELALSLPEHPRAAESHMLAIHHASLQARSLRADDVAQYAALLHEHVEQWPDSSTSAEAWWHLGRLHQFQRQWAEAIVAYRQVPPEHARFAEAVAALGECVVRRLSLLGGGPTAASREADEAAGYLESIVVGPHNAWPVQWTAAQRAAALSAARIRLIFGGRIDDYRTAEQLLQQALRGEPQPDAAWRAAALSLKVFALAGQRRSDEARRVLEQISDAPPTELLHLLVGLAREARTAAPEVRRALAELQLLAARLLEPRASQLDAAGAKQFRLLWAEALAASGQYEQASQMYDELSRQYPRDGDIPEAHAEALLATGDMNAAQRALTLWRDLERRTAPDTPRWYRAKYGLARAYEQLGRRAEAAKVVTLLQVLYPELGGEELKPRFLELLQRCQ
jgi:TolA-binding protein